MKKRVITISREFGSGGRSIGKEVAHRLGIGYYDKELVGKIAQESGFAPQYIEGRDELSPTKSGIYYALEPHSTYGGMNGMSNSDLVWKCQKDVINKLAEKEPCVIVGRCADFILKDREDCIHVFIHADMKSRAERILNLYGERDASPEKRLKDQDKKRRVHYKHFTDHEWGMSQNYTLSLNSSQIGIEKCVDIIVDLFNQEQ